jgi:hypothetical protein
MNRGLIIALVIGLSVALGIGFFSSQNDNSTEVEPQSVTLEIGPENQSGTSSSSSISIIGQAFTRAQLSSYDGNRLPCYIAVNQRVYDVSNTDEDLLCGLLVSMNDNPELYSSEALSEREVIGTLVN